MAVYRASVGIITETLTNRASTGSYSDALIPILELVTVLIMMASAGICSEEHANLKLLILDVFLHLPTSIVTTWFSDR